MLPRNCGDFLDRLLGTDLVIGVHDADQERLWSNGAAHVLRIDHARAVDWKVSDRSAEPFEKPAGSKNSGMHIAEVMMCAPLRFRAKKMPLIARLFASLP